MGDSKRKKLFLRGKTKLNKNTHKSKVFFGVGFLAYTR